MGDNWHTVAQYLAPTHTIYLVDQRNHGKSFHSDEMNYHLMAQDVLDLMADQCLENVILIGHSMGGKTAMMCANLMPHKISKLIVVDIAPKQYKPSHQHYFDVLNALNLKTPSRKDIETELALSIENKGEILFLMKNIYRTEGDDFGFKFNLQAIERSYSEILSEIKFDGALAIQTLFIKGENSSYITTQDQEEIKQHFDHVKIDEVDKSGHWVHADNPTGFLTVLLSFLNS